MNGNLFTKDSILPNSLELDEADDEKSNSIFNSKILGSSNLDFDTNDLFSLNAELFNYNFDSDIFNINPFELKSDTLKSKALFLVEGTNKKRGRKSQKISNTKIHLNSSKDNITSKIQIHFLNFVIYVINDYIYYFTKNKQLNLKKFMHSEKCKISKVYINKLKSWKINDLLEKMNISNKYKRYEKDHNIVIRDKLIKFPWFQQLSKVTIKTLFNIFYNNKQPLEKINLIGEEIIPSVKIRTLYDLLKENKKLEELIVETAENIYIK